MKDPKTITNTKRYVFEVKAKLMVDNFYSLFQNIDIKLLTFSPYLVYPFLAHLSRRPK